MRNCILFVVSFVGLVLGAASADAQIATRDTAATLLPPGDYECKLGSYAFRACTVEAAGHGVTLVIPQGIGHFFSMRAEVMPSDDKGELTVLGRFIDTDHLGHETCAPDAPDSKDCIGTPEDRRGYLEQPLVSRVKKSGDQWRGQLYYYILRPAYDFSNPQSTRYLGYFKLGNRVDFAIRPAKKKK